MHIAWLQVCHSEGSLHRFASSGKGGSVFLLERQVVGRKTVSKEPDKLRLINPVLVEVRSGNKDKRSAAVGDLRTIRYFERGSYAGVLVRDLGCAVIGQVGVAHLGERIQAGVRVIFVCYPGEFLLGSAIFLDVNLRDLAE